MKFDVFFLQIYIYKAAKIIW